MSSSTLLVFAILPHWRIVSGDISPIYILLKERKEE
jgi:hypothetical protein